MPIQSYNGAVGVAFDNALPLLSPRVQAGSSLPPGLTLNLDRVSGTPQSIGDYTTFFQYDFVAVKISSGGGHSLALRDDGSVIGWGDNFEGQSAPPTGLTGVTDIAAGGVHSLALKNDGTVVGWGRNTENQATPPSGLSGVTAIAAGLLHSLALKSDGTVVGWGKDNYNQATPPSGLSGVTAIAAGTHYSLALKSDGTVVGWGLNGNNQATPPGGLTGVTRIAAGTYHSLALKSDGTIIGWGSNSYGQLTIPSGLSGVTDITAGFQVSYALKNDGTVVMWGYNGSGQIEWNQPSPFNVPSGLSGVSYLSTFEKHTLALKSDGIVVAWGNNNTAQTDVPELTESASFNISAGTPIITANQNFSGTAGFVFSASPALTDSANRPVTSWSAVGLPAGLTLNAATGEITGTPQGTGNTTTTLTATGPGGTDTETAVISVAKEAMTIISGQIFTGKVGETFLPATPAYTGAVNSWSATGLPSGLAINSGSGLISGLPINKGESSATINATGPLIALKVASGIYHTLAVKYDGTVVAWGENFVDGGGTGLLDIPSGLDGVVDVAAGLRFSLALKSDGTVVGWGKNNLGQVTIPAGLSNVIAIAAGYYHSLALKSDGTVVGWGDNSIGQINVPSELQMPNFSGVVAIAAGSFHSLALNSLGSAKAWGYTKSASNGNNINFPVDYGQTSVPADLSLSITAIAAGDYHNLAIKKDGTVVGWGRPTEGQITIPSGLSGVFKIATKGSYCLALKSDGAVVSWGEGSTALNISDAIAISTSGIYSVALKTNGTLEDWGNSSYGPIPLDSDSNTIGFAIAEGAPIITSGQAGSGKVGEAFSKTFSLTDSVNRPVTSWSATGLPSWATLNTSTGAITGTPQDSGSTTITLTATGPGGTDTETAAISIAAGPPIITAGQSYTGKVGEVFSQALSLDDAADRPATSWSASALPAGLTLNTATGLISGSPTTKGSFTASFTATGGGGTSAAASVAFTVSEGVPIITSGQSATGKVGEAFSKTFSLTDSTNRPVTSWDSAGLPSWASLNASTGTITGTPQDSGSTTITLTATGPGGMDTETAAISIAAGAPIIVSGQSLTGKVGEVFPSATLTLDDALDRPATSWAATGLPAGLTLNTATGAITGTPTNIGAVTASFTATGGGGTSAASSVAFTISEGAPIITAGQTLSGTVGVAFIRTPALTDATNRPVTSWAATALPDWATLNAATGAIMGIPTAAAITTITLTATGPGGEDTETASISISTSGGGGGGDGGGGTITPTMQLTPQQDFAATLGIAFNRTPSILSGTPVSWYATGLPAWATINATTGAITGTPNFTGVFNVTVTAQDSGGSVSSTSITLTTVSWNTLEVFIDPRARKILSRANTRSVMQKMFLKRDDLVNFQVVFVNDDQPFGLPSDFAVTVGIKASYAATAFIAFSDSVNGTLSLASDTVQDLFADEPDTVEAIFEVKWEDETSASRTASLPVIIQNTILRGNTAEPVANTGGGFTASGLSKYLAARQKILTGETAETTTLTLSEPLAGEAIFHRPLANNLPAQRGWITGVSAVSLQGDTGTEALVAEEDFVFYPDRQCFYFLNPETTGDIEILGTASRNFINFGVTINKSVTAASSTSTLIDTASPDFEITSVSITSEDMGTESLNRFYFDRVTATLFLETLFSGSSVVVVFKDALGVEFQETFGGITDNSTISVPKSLSAASVVRVTLTDTTIDGENIGDFTPFAVLEKTAEEDDDILHLGWNYPSGYTNGDFTVSATNGSDSFVFTFQYWPGNAFELPRLLDNVHTLKIGGSDALVVFDSTEQKLDFCQAKTGTLHYTATHKAYEGLANGGETLQVVAEIPGVFATTAGTGHHISTLRTLNPSQDWYNWWYAEEGIYFVQIVDDKNVVIYQDDSNGAFAKSRPGYTAEELKPITLKLPFAALWSLSPRDDTSLFQEAFTPNFATATFSSATYPELDDTQRYAAESMGAGKTITLSTNKTAPVRGVQGVNFTGPKPTYYAGGTVPYFVLATYKWFVVKCVNPNSNPLLTANKNYLLCVNNTNFDNRAIMVNITNEGYNVAADLYEIKGGN